MNNELLKFIKSLQLKKFRKLHSAFFVEGKVNVLECLQSNLEIQYLLLTLEAQKEFKNEFSDTAQIITVSEKELIKMGTFKSNSFGLAVLSIPMEEPTILKSGEWVIALDDVNDPGNLGTIVRTADWFGIQQVICSENTVDFYSPKVVNSTKGSFSRVKVSYENLEELSQTNTVITAEMNGENIYDFKWPHEGGIILMGNESHGVSEKLSKLASHHVTIPRKGGAESLNVGIATAIFCSQLSQSLDQK